MERIDEFRCVQIIADLIVGYYKFDKALFKKLSEWMRAYLDSLPYEDEDGRLIEAHFEALSRARGVLQMHLMTICPKMSEQLALDVADMLAHDLG